MSIYLFIFKYIKKNNNNEIFKYIKNKKNNETKIAQNKIRYCKVILKYFYDDFGMPNK